MRYPTLLAILFAAPLLCDNLEAQRGGGGRGGGGRGNSWQRPDEIKNRLAVTFQDAKAPATEGDKVADLDSIELVRAAASVNQPTLLYLYDGKADEKTARDFENQLFRADAAGDERNAKALAFHLGRIDVQSDPALQQRFGEQTPLFVVFDTDGKEVKSLSMTGFELDERGLEAALDKAGKGAVKPSLASFAKKYVDLLHDLEKVLKEKEQATRAQAKAGADKAKQKKAEKELEQIGKEEQKLLDKEKELLEKARLPQRPEGGTQVGGQRFRSKRGNTGRG